jgi:hypothetical protein
MEHAQAMIFGNCRVTVAEITAGLGIYITHSWLKPLLQQPSLCHTHSAQMDYITEPHPQHVTV